METTSNKFTNDKTGGKIFLMPVLETGKLQKK